jgi:HPt (histidine-containing phosphotransfer) domain-containing protein
MIKIIYSSRNPYLLTGDSFNLDTFKRYNILTGENKSELSKVRNGTLLNHEILFESDDNLFCVSSPLKILNKIFGYFIFFKTEYNYSDNTLLIIENLTFYAGTQLNKLINNHANCSLKENLSEEDKDNSKTEIDINKYIKNNSLNKTNKPMDLSNEDILDMNIIQNLRELGGDEDNSFLKEVIDLYLTQAPGLMNDIRMAANGNNSLKLSQASHAMKGASLNIGAKKFSEICKTLELKGRNNEMNALEILLKEMDECFIVTSDELIKLTN